MAYLLNLSNCVFLILGKVWHVPGKTDVGLAATAAHSHQPACHRIELVCRVAVWIPSEVASNRGADARARAEPVRSISEEARVQRLTPYEITKNPLLLLFLYSAATASR